MTCRNLRGRIGLAVCDDVAAAVIGKPKEPHGTINPGPTAEPI